MPPSSTNRPHNKLVTKHKFHCLNCFSLMYTSKKYSQFNGTITTYPNSSKPPSYTCRSLTKHLNDVNHTDCHAFYVQTAQALLVQKAVNNTESMHRKKSAIDYETSVVGRNRNTSERTNSQSTLVSNFLITPQQLGLTMTDNGPICSRASCTAPPSDQQHDSCDMHTVLNKQVIPNTLIPFVDRQAIINAFNHAPILTIDETQPHNGFDDTNFGLDDNSITNIDSDEYSEPNPDHIDLPQPPPTHSDIPFFTNFNELARDRDNREVFPLSAHFQVQIDLLELLIENGLHLNMFDKIYKWAVKSQSRVGFDFPTHPFQKRDTVLTKLRKEVNIPVGYKQFVPRLINWLPDNKVTQVYVQPFTDALYSLLSKKNLMIEDNLSFPDITTPLSGVQNPSINDDSIISELHHGEWWTNSWAQICKPDSNEILVPIILYMDGISIDNNGRLSLTPLNMTLGIFNIETRTRPESWETIYFHPSNEFESKHHDQTTTSQDSLKNLHVGLKEALKTFDQACKLKDGIEWDYLPYNK